MTRRDYSMYRQKKQGSWILYGVNRNDCVVIILRILIENDKVPDIQIENPQAYKITKARELWRKAISEGWDYSQHGFVDGVILQKMKEWRLLISKIKSDDALFTDLATAWLAPYDKMTKGKELRVVGTKSYYESLNQPYCPSEYDCNYHIGDDLDSIEDSTRRKDFDNYWNEEGLLESESDLRDWFTHDCE